MRLELPPVLQPLDRQAGGEVEVLDGELLGVRVAHRLERVVLPAEVGRAEVAGPQADRHRVGHARRAPACRACGGRTPSTRSSRCSGTSPSCPRRWRPPRPVRMLVRGAEVVAVVVVERADDRELVGDLRLEGEELADLHAGDVGLDRPPDAAVLGRGLGLHVVHVHVPGPAVEPEEDDGGVLLARAVRVAALRRAQHAAQPDRRHPRDAHLEKAPPAHAVAVALRLPGRVDAEHAGSSRYRTPSSTLPAASTCVEAIRRRAGSGFRSGVPAGLPDKDDEALCPVSPPPRSGALRIQSAPLRGSGETRASERRKTFGYVQPAGSIMRARRAWVSASCTGDSGNGDGRAFGAGSVGMSKRAEQGLEATGPVRNLRIRFWGVQGSCPVHPPLHVIREFTRQVAIHTLEQALADMAAKSKGGAARTAAGASASRTCSAGPPTADADRRLPAPTRPARLPRLRRRDHLRRGRDRRRRGHRLRRRQRHPPLRPVHPQPLEGPRRPHAPLLRLPRAPRPPQRPAVQPLRLHPQQPVHRPRLRQLPLPAGAGRALRHLLPPDRRDHPPRRPARLHDDGRHASRAPRSATTTTPAGTSRASTRRGTSATSASRCTIGQTTITPFNVYHGLTRVLAYKIERGGKSVRLLHRPRAAPRHRPRPTSASARAWPPRSASASTARTPTSATSTASTASPSTSARRASAPRRRCRRWTGATAASRTSSAGRCSAASSARSSATTTPTASGASSSTMDRELFDASRGTGCQIELAKPDTVIDL